MRKALVLAGIAFLVIAASGQDDQILQLKEKIIQLQNQGELGFSSVTLCSNIFGFASYVPLPGNVIDAKGSLILYYEPVNIFTSVKEGIYEIWYNQDLALYKEGEMVQEWKDFLQFKYASNKPAMDLFARNSVDFEGRLPAGNYSLKLVIKDQLSGKTAEKTVDFQLK
jgi:hypothetical protein